ncbi:dTDP-4-amino-4,6-dideoxygalactose transaminase [Verrucomicrobia bacterium LW23]|nr:dTDP-4-amino-4,6-dideoxygalactose transaminase [Verrucomicrobia bacterium LW23]
MSSKLPFNVPFLAGKELAYISKCGETRILAGDGPFTKQCNALLEQRTATRKALLTHSCTAALEMAALLLDIQPGDEVIMPSYTFVSTANAFVLRGGVPVFIDIRPDTLNLNEVLIEDAITPRTKAIVPVHYAGVGCEMDSILALAKEHNIKVVEDAAQGALASYKGKALGSMGELGTLSFHESKNLISGEGGALLVNDPEYIHRAEIIREKGTDRSRFYRGEVDKYTWQEVGSSYLPGEIIAAMLLAQLEDADTITSLRMQVWNKYHAMLQKLEEKGSLRRPIIPCECTHNAHMYYVLLDPSIRREHVLKEFQAQAIHAYFHYVPLHSSPAGRRYGKTCGALPVTDSLSEQIIRLPLWCGISEEQQNRVVSLIEKFC